MFHAGPDATQVDVVDAFELFDSFVDSIAAWDHDPGVVECHVESAERVDGGSDGGCDVVPGGDVAADADRGATLGAQRSGCGDRAVGAAIRE